MRRPLELLNDIQIASPCTADWDAMAGSERVRHCAECQQSVFDISRMTAPEAVALLTSGGHVCVRLYRRSDGTVLTQDCSVGRGARLRRSARRLMAAVASWLGFMSVAGCKHNTMGLVPPMDAPAINAPPLIPEGADSKGGTADAPKQVAEAPKGEDGKPLNLIMGTPLALPRAKCDQTDGK